MISILQPTLRGDTTTAVTTETQGSSGFNIQITNQNITQTLFSLQSNEKHNRRIHSSTTHHAD